jgi:FKBP-type peptidyl-prolyl cis-trans isomerase 2
VHAARTSARLLSLLLLSFAEGAQAEDAAAPQQGTAPPAARPPAEKVVEAGDWVWIDFALWEGSGALLDTSTHTSPLRIKHGNGTVPSAVEQAMLGMAVEEHKTVRLPMTAAGEESDPTRYESVALDSLPETTREVGHAIVKDDGSGKLRAGRVREIDGDRAIIDWTPLSGQTLTFDFRIVEIYAPPEEVPPGPSDASPPPGPTTD